MALRQNINTAAVLAVVVWLGITSITIGQSQDQQPPDSTAIESGVAAACRAKSA